MPGGRRADNRLHRSLANLLKSLLLGTELPNAAFRIANKEGSHILNDTSFLTNLVGLIMKLLAKTSFLFLSFASFAFCCVAIASPQAGDPITPNHKCLALGAGDARRATNCTAQNCHLFTTTCPNGGGTWQRRGKYAEVPFNQCTPINDAICTDLGTANRQNCMTYQVHGNSNCTLWKCTVTVWHNRCK